jgi:hypothetical protein
MPTNPRAEAYRKSRMDDFANRRSWLVDTAETKEDQRKLKDELKKLDRAQSWASRTSRGNN